LSEEPEVFEECRDVLIEATCGDFGFFGNSEIAAGYGCDYDITFNTCDLANTWKVDQYDY